MNLGIEGRTALVAAASRGMGRAIASGLAGEGCRVAICARREDRVLETAKEISAQTGVETLGIGGDVRSDDDVARIVETTIGRFGPIDILVNNAGGPEAGGFEDLPLEAWESAFRLNLRSAVVFSRAVVPAMRSRKWGRIVNLASVSVKQPIDGLMLSNSLRAGVAGFSKSLATECAADNVLVNVVCPGYTSTDRLVELARTRARTAGTTVEEILGKMQCTVPARRIGRPEEIADVVVYLCSDRASYVTGTVIAVDGGLCRGLL